MATGHGLGVAVLTSRRTLRVQLVRVAALAEQEVRAHPRLHAAFYRGVRSSPRVNRALGRVLSAVRSSSASTTEVGVLEDSAAVRDRRLEAVRQRLGTGSGEAA